MKQNTASNVKEIDAKAGKVSQRPAKQPTTRREATTNNQNTGRPRQPPRDGCLICKGSHLARDCRTVTTEQKTEEEKMLREKLERQKERVKLVVTDDEPTYRTLVINGVLEVPFCHDTGSDANIIDKVVLAEVRGIISYLPVVTVEPPVEVVATGGHMWRSGSAKSQDRRSPLVRLDLQIVTGAGPLALTDVEYLVISTAEEELLLGRSTLQSIGVDLDGILEQLAQQDLGMAEAEADDIPSDSVEVMGAPEEDEVKQALRRVVDDAMEAGFDVALEKYLRELVMSYADIFRLRLGSDEPADVESLEVTNYIGLVCVAILRGSDNSYVSTSVSWKQPASCNATTIVAGLARLYLSPNKAPTSSESLPVNKLTVPLASATPNLAVLIESVRGACGFGTFDFYKGFWQMTLHPNSRGLFSFVTEDGVFTSTRVPQEARTFVSHRTSVDWRRLAKTPGAFLKNLERFFSILRQRKLKLNVRKCKLFVRRVKWSCIAAFPLCLEQVTGLDDRFLQDSRPSEKLERVMLKRGRRKSQLSGATLVWTESEREAFRVALEMMERSCKLIFPDKGATVCIFADASLTGWALVVTQVRNWQNDAPVEQQAHNLLICRGGRFKKAQLNWSIVEKEGYLIVTAYGDLDYMLRREKSFYVYCDRSNLIKPFAPDTEVNAHVKRKLQRRVLNSGGLLSAKIVLAQQQHQGDAPDGPTQLDEAIMVPRNSKSLTKRLLVVAECGNQGHRGLHVMVEFLSRHFALANLRQTVTRFINPCLLCKHVKGGLVVQPRGRAKRVAYLYISESYGNAKYVVVLKDELTHFCELVATDTTDSHTEVAAILDWN
ncbi:LOW QUALITY PROTEIN: Hypothetical protein PHPALM_11786 [Phytophthora palmivora]|uniref:Reverse transcriptase RNase H-like domain-containing protein n=1 Tax=Phytophthora palmivora TaxID=4796 RepID=A0A2P4Y1F2_9STRA|nr:LOW QUALITY PROTEIN: Hypothetical protein PHPALM_11786 [Phytophthora palmivora]